MILQTYLLYLLFVFNIIHDTYSDCFDTDDESCTNTRFLSRSQTVNNNNNKNSLVNVYDYPKPFSSACLKCVLCATIANKLQKTLELLHSDFPPRQLIQSKNTLKDSLRLLCENGFRKYDLRQNEDVRYLTENTNISNDLDNIWTFKLKEMCHNYLNIAEEWAIYMRWFHESHKPDFDIVNFLCRSYGIFQHCRNIPLANEETRRYTKLIE